MSRDCEFIILLLVVLFLPEVPKLFFNIERFQNFLLIKYNNKPPQHLCMLQKYALEIYYIKDKYLSRSI